MSQQTFLLLGRKLKELRNRANETLAEASGAVEIDVKELARFELGHARPSEEILLLLISHFSASDEDALKLWQLGGYSADNPPPSYKDSAEANLRQIASELEKPILFTDVIDVVVNKYGVVLNFMQNSSRDTAPAPVARVGMSREHAKSVLQILQLTLSQTESATPKLPNRIINPDSSISDEKTKG